MIGSATKLFQLLALSALLACAIPAAVAQDAEGEEESDGATGAPINLFGGFEEEPEPEEAGTTSVRAQPGTGNAVAVSSLGSIEAQVTGILDLHEGGFGEHMWSGSRRVVVERLVPDIPTRTSSMAMRQLSYRLLASAARDPAGERAGPSLLSLRARKLYDLGFVDAAGDMARQDLTQEGDPDVLAVVADLALLEDDIPTACAQAARTRSQSTEAFWLKLRAFCYVIAEDVASARLAADLLSEEGYRDDSYYALLWTVIDGVPLEALSLETVSPIHLSLLELADKKLPTEAIAAADLPTLLRIANTGMAGGKAVDLMSERLPAAEEAARVGALEPRKLALLYSNVPFLQSELAALVEKVYENQSPQARAALYQFVDAQTVSSAKASQLKKALDVGRLSGTYSISISVYGPLVGELAAENSMAPFALDFVPALYGIGHYAHGGEWLELALAHDSLQVMDGAAPQPKLKAYEAMRYMRALPAEDQLVQWDPVARLTSAGPDAAYSLVVHELRLIEALGMDLPPEARQLMLARPLQIEGQMPASGVLSGLDAAARAGRVAETVLYGLVALGEAGPQGAPTAVVERVVAAYARAGLFVEAQSLAIESLLARAN